MNHQNTPEHIAHGLWAVRNKFRRLHKVEFATELSVLDNVRHDLSRKFYHDLPSAIDFYRDLHYAIQQEETA